MRIAVVGLGEAGRLYAEGFAGLGAQVSGFDPVAAQDPEGVRRDASIAAAVGDADFVVSLVGASFSSAVLDESLASMPADAVFADLNTGAPAQKAELAAAAAAAQRRFVDVAVMAPVPRAGAMTPLLASGDGAERLVSAWSQLGVPVSAVGPDAGTAAGLKMLRSVFMKGLAAVVMEAASAAEIAGSRDWMLAEMASELGPDGPALVERLVDGTRQHAARREHEMRDAEAYLGTLAAPAWVTGATIQWLHALAEDPAFPTG
ncbi:NAD(P)-dependent oxidoreductase [Naasia lichenicola]|nr:NAD(P)-dependent oxidoreductase [Naasia lichenicola]